MNRPSKIGLWVTLLISLTGQIFQPAQAHKQPPIPAERRYSDRGIVECINKSTAPIEQRLKDIKKQETISKKAKVSIEPLVLERRRLEEQLCGIEARCLADAVPRSREHYYGLTLSTCLENQG